MGIINIGIMTFKSLVYNIVGEIPNALIPLLTALRLIFPTFAG